MRHHRSTRTGRAGADRLQRWRSTSLPALAAVVAALALPSIVSGASTATTAVNVTIVAQNLAGEEISDFTFLISEDNAARRTDPQAERPGRRPTPSYIPLVAAGDQDSASVSLDSGRRYLVTVKSPNHKLWGKHFTAAADQQVVVQLKHHPQPLGKLVVHAFQDNQPVNAAPDASVEQPLSGFEVRLHDTVGEMQADYNGDPLCGGVCLTGDNGNVTIPNLAPGRYELEVLPPDGTDWIQTTTFEGTHLYDFVRVTEDDDGLGAIGEAAVAAGIPTAWWFGFVQPKEITGGAGEVRGTARTWVGWPPYNEISLGDPVKQAVVALSNVGAADQQVYTGFADPDTGEFTIGNIPDGTYTLSIFDLNLDWIIHYVTFTLPDAGGSRSLDLDVDGVNGTGRGIPVARWFGWVSGYVFEDLNGDAVKDPGEEGIDGMDLDLRFRDGSVKAGTFTAPNPDPLGLGESGFYEYAELLSPLSKFLISEVGFPRLARTGSSLHDEFDPTSVTPLPEGLGGGLLLNQMTAEGHRSWIDWGKRPYAEDDLSTPAYEGEHGGITGIVYYATTRNELDPSLAGAEDYEPGIPDATVKLWGLAPDGDPADVDDYTVLLNEVTTDAWSHPRSDHPVEPQSCEARDAFGGPEGPYNPDIEANCIEFPTLSNQTKDGAFDGGYAIETTSDDELLVPGDYVVEVVPPPFYQVIKEEDQNTAEGDELIPQIPPPPCVGPLHEVPLDSGHPDAGDDKPLCNKKLVTLDDGQNPAADFFLFTDADDDPETNTVPLGSWNTAESVAPPGRIFGLVADDLRFDVDPTSPWYGQPMALPNIPVGVYDYTGRLITMLHTDEFGLYDVTLPSTQTYNCPTPAGVCPGMYVLRIDDPADPAFNPDFLTAVLAFDVWPGKTTYADTPVDPISAVACTLGPFAEGQGQQPEFLRVSNPYILRDASTANQAQRELTIDGVGFGASRGTGVVTLGGSALPADAYVAWSDRLIRVRVPRNFGPPGPHQLLIRGANGVWTPLGITIHSRDNAYFPPIVEVGPNQSIQDAIDSAAVESLIVVRPGVHVENVILRKRVKLQGVGPGGTIGALENAVPDDLRFTITGSVINARNFFDREAEWEAELASQSFVGNQTIPGGAAITVVAPTQGYYDPSGNIDRRRAMIDGFGITLGQSLEGGAGGIQVNSYARQLWISNNILENNGGGIGGGIALGTPATFAGRTGGLDNENDNIRIAHNRILGNGALTNGGGVAIYNGADKYTIERNQICSNYSVTYGAGVGHFGSSGNTNLILDNHFYGNEAFDSGGGLMVSGEKPVTSGGVGTGRVDVRRNYIWFNVSNDDGGGMFIRDTRNSEIWLASNIIANNVATDVGGGIALDDVPAARIINNTVARNSSTDTAEDRDGLPNGAGLVSERNDSGTGFSQPVHFRNNIFWQNEAFTFDPTGGEGGEPALVSAGVFDLEVLTAAGVFNPITSLLTELDPANFSNPPLALNQIGVNPQFVSEYINEIEAAPTVFGTGGEIQTTLFRNDPPPPFKEGAPGDYHLTAASPLVTRVGGSAGILGLFLFAPRCDIDRQLLPSLLGVTTIAPRGADWRTTNAPVDNCPS